MIQRLFAWLGWHLAGNLPVHRIKNRVWRIANRTVLRLNEYRDEVIP